MSPAPPPTQRTDTGPAPDLPARIEQAIAHAYARAPRLPDAPESALSAVTPLFRLTEGYELVVHEVPDLSPLKAAVHLNAYAGRPMVATSRDDDPLAGYLYANGCGGWILVRAGDRLTRRRFSVAHELGHYVLHVLPLIAGWTAGAPGQPLAGEEDDADGPEFEEALPPGADEELVERGQIMVASLRDAEEASMAHCAEAPDLEDEADCFAAELLMPAWRCRTLAEQHGQTYAHRRSVLARRLATEFLVSRQAMERRLTELSLGHAP